MCARLAQLPTRRSRVQSSDWVQLWATFFRLVSRRSIGGLKRTHTLVDKGAFIFRRGWGWGGGGPKESRGGSLNFYMNKKGGHPIFHNTERGRQEISAHLLSSTWLNNVPINIYSEVERARERPPNKFTFIH